MPVTLAFPGRSFELERTVVSAEAGRGHLSVWRFDTCNVFADTYKCINSMGRARVARAIPRGVRKVDRCGISFLSVRHHSRCHHPVAWSRCLSHPRSTKNFQTHQGWQNGLQLQCDTELDWIEMRSVKRERSLRKAPAGTCVLAGDARKGQLGRLRECVSLGLSDVRSVLLLVCIIRQAFPPSC